nr:hypothetical protein [Tanacetum cinerariifolium]
MLMMLMLLVLLLKVLLVFMLMPDVDEPSIPSLTPPTPPPQPSQDIPSTSQVQLTLPHSPQAQPPSPQHQPQPSQDAEISMDFLQNILGTCTTLTRRVDHLEQDKIAKALEITKLKQRVKKLERRNKLKVLKLRRLKRVRTTQMIETSNDTVMDNVSKQGRMIADMDADVDVTLKDIAKDVALDARIEESADVQGRQAKSQAQIYKIDLEHAKKVLSMQEEESKPTELQEVVYVVTTAKIITEVVTTASTTITAADASILAATINAAPSTLTTASSAARRRKGVVIRDPKETATPSTIIHSEAKSKDKGKGILTKEQVDEEDSRALKRINKSKEDKATKRQKLDEKVEELRRHLQIVPNDEDDVYTEATPLALKVTVVYEIYNEHNKPYYKIKRADDSYQLYLSFLSMLRNFDREDLEALWRLVKVRFATTKPKNFSDDLLLTTLRAMFEKPNVQAQIWKNQRSVHGQAKVKSWKLLESCGV